MAFTGNQHVRFLIAARFLESFCQRYSLPAQISCSIYYVTINLPERVELSSSMLSEWSEIIDKYTKYYYTLKLVDNHFQVRID